MQRASIRTHPGLPADHAQGTIRKAYAPADERDGRDPAGGGKPQKALVVYPGDHQADLVHVCGYHHRHARASATLEGNEVAQRIGAHVIHVWPHQLLNQRADLLLVA